MRDRRRGPPAHRGDSFRRDGKRGLPAHVMGDVHDRRAQGGGRSEALRLRDRVELIREQARPRVRAQALERAGQRVGEGIDHRDGHARVGEATLERSLGPPRVQGLGEGVRPHRDASESRAFRRVDELRQRGLQEVGAAQADVGYGDGHVRTILDL